MESFGFQPGRRLSGKYEVVDLLGAGWEGEVYLVRERETQIERAAKFFFPERNPGNRTLRRHAKKLHELRHCPSVIQYHTQDTVRVRRAPMTYLVSDFVSGRLLGDFLADQPGRRLTPFAALHLLHALARGVECIHDAGEYHGDLHAHNIFVERYGLEFELKFIDLFHQPGPKREAMADDLVEVVRVFYEALGGARHYARLPDAVKYICRGMKRGLILKRFRNVRRLRAHIETMEWD